MSSKSDNLRYSIIPARAITDPNITAQALRVLALLGRHGDDNGWCRRSQVRMANELACSRGTIQNALDLLIGPENGTGYVERREETRPGVLPEEGRHPHCSYSYRVRLDLDDEERAEGANRLARPRANRKAGGASPEQHGVPTSLAPITEHSPCERPLGNTPAPEGADCGGVDSLGNESSDRFPEFRKAVDDTWPGGFPPGNEVAARKEFEQQTKLHLLDLVLTCARLHGAAKRKENDGRNKGAGNVTMKYPSNWLKGDWQGYIPQAESEAARELETVSALGNVRRALGEGMFGLLKQLMPEASLARLDGVGLEVPATFTITNPFQRRLLEQHEPKLERLLTERPRYVVVPKVATG